MSEPTHETPHIVIPQERAHANSDEMDERTAGHLRDTVWDKRRTKWLQIAAGIGVGTVLLRFGIPLVTAGPIGAVLAGAAATGLGTAAWQVWKGARSADARAEKAVIKAEREAGVPRRRAA